MNCRVLLLLDTPSFTAVKYWLANVLVAMAAASSNGWPCRKQSTLVFKRCSKCLIRAVVV